MFYNNYIVYYNVYWYYCGVFIESMCIPSFVLIGCCVSELRGHLCPYRNVLPEAVYCCFTRTALFTKLFTRLYDQNLRLLSHYQVLLFYTLWFALPEAVYCCFTRTSLFTKLLTCKYHQTYKLLSRHQVSLLYTF